MAEPKELRILYVEDVPQDAELCLHALQKAGYQITADVVSTKEEFTRKLESGFYAVVLSDYRMPGWNGMEALEALKRSAKDIPFILVTGTIGEEAAVECVKQGAADYILKDRPARLPAAIGSALEEKAAREERARMEDELRQREEHFRRLVEHIHDALITEDTAGKVTFANDQFLALFGFERGQLPHLKLEDYVAPEWREQLQDRRQRRMRGETAPAAFEYEGLRRDGRRLWLEVDVVPLLDRSGQVMGTQSTIRDVTERKQAEAALLKAEEKYFRIFNEAVVGIFQITPDGRYLSVNPEFARLHGYDSPAELMASGADNASQAFVDPSERERFKRQLEEKGSVHNCEYQACRKDGSKMWLLENARVVRDSSGATLYYEGTVADITDRKVAVERAQYLAYYDALTGLPNRTLLQDRLTKALAGARRQKAKVALLFLDLDRFKNINDSLGHSVGDLVLQEVAQRLKRWVREQDTVARLAGDEFLVVLNGIKDIPDAAVAAERFMDTIGAQFVVQGHSLGIGCSLGISIFPEHGTDGETLIKNADAAMYSAKDSGRNCFRFFTGDMSAQAVERLILETGLRSALERRELFLVYQPQVEIATGNISGAEALLRWRHPELGLVPPDKFIPIAENSGLIMPIGEWVLKTACAQAKQWQDEGLSPVPVAVNVSAVQFRQEGFCKLIGRVLRETGLAPQYLDLELTEGLLLATASLTISVLKELKEMGVKLSIDDFGTGYSSLSYLRHFPVYKLKIDRSFVQAMTVNSDDAAITATIINMAKSLNLRVIAEGVESEQQMLFLRANHCDEVQGYYFSPPLAAGEFAKKVRSILGDEVTMKCAP